MLKGAANTLTETATQIQPRTWARTELFTRKCEKMIIKPNKPKFIEARPLKVETCIISIHTQELLIKFTSNS